jgi:hypothetical protein
MFKLEEWNTEKMDFELKEYEEVKSSVVRQSSVFERIIAQQEEELDL